MAPGAMPAMTMRRWLRHSAPSARNRPGTPPPEQLRRAAEPGAQVGAVALHPLFHVAVDARELDLQAVADDGQGEGARQAADLAQRPRNVGCGGVVEWRHGHLLSIR